MEHICEAGVSWSTHTYLVENVLEKNFISAQHQVMGRYITFFQSLLNSPNMEVRILARIVLQNKRSVTWLNMDYLSEVSGLSPWDYSKTRITAELSKCEVKDIDTWRLSFLSKLLDQRWCNNNTNSTQQLDSIQVWIDSICST